MKTMILKGLFLCLVFLLCNATSHAAEDLITQQITINLYEAGTLSDKIESSKKYKITNLKIIGKINGTDLRMIREMAGCDYEGKSTEGNLYVLDLSKAKIVEGGDEYYIGSSKFYYTSNGEIGACAFEGCNKLMSITLPTGITKIGQGAFDSCSKLTSLTLPAGVTEIGTCAFGDCSGLTSLTLPASITKIDIGAFYGCSGLTSLTLPAGITKIDIDTFHGCSGLTSLTIPAGVTEIGGGAFDKCRGLTSLTIPAGVTEIERYTFNCCSGLTDLIQIYFTRF